MSDKKIQIPIISKKPIDEKGYEELVQDIENRLKIHLSNYKVDYIKRRLLSRMNSTRQESYVDYHAYLRKNSEAEEEKLRNALTINVTKFYRDIAVFNLIRDVIFPDVLNKNKKIRIWSGGCSSGEEPYTYAIMIYELTRGTTLGNVILATDIDQEILKKAKEGVYEKSALDNLDPKLVTKHFEQLSDGKYKVKDHIKSMVQFQQHDLMKGIPASRDNDVVSCRNVTIYFNDEQKKLLVKLMYDALKPEGYYIMGMSEYISKDVEHLFNSYKPIYKIYTKAIETK
jgi:chemotaxis protein methyltransferase CheR